MIKVEVSGLEALKTSLDLRSEKLQGEMLKRSFFEGGKTLEQSVRALTPVATGWLRATIQTRAKGGKRPSATVESPKKAFPKFPYASAVDFGHFQGSRKRSDRKWVKGQRFFENALLQNNDRVATQIVENIKQEIEKDGGV